MKSEICLKTKMTKNLQKGFTLVETVLALGIVATVMVTLMALLPTGMDIMKEAGTNTVGARIVITISWHQHVVADIVLKLFAKW